MKVRTTSFFVFLILFACTAVACGSFLIAPETPLGLTVSGATPSSLTISWKAANGAQGYRLYRDTVFNGAFKSMVFESATADATSFTDSALSEGSVYCYKVKSYNLWGSSALSPTVMGRTGSLPAASAHP